MSAPSLFGTWNLLSWEIRSSEGAVTYPIGGNPTGVLSYDEAGRMAVQVMQSDRVLSQSADPFGAAADEIVAAWMGFLSYAGRYDHDPDAKRVIHHVEICSFPNWVGSRQERFYDFDDGLLLLSTPPLSLGGDSAVSTLIWEPMKHS